ncbi:MobF family relaxase [Agromyces larvae]|uniref:MobF family relaxase n=1 Tax=Agromyces larvae TaxID=2929802 RepID=UPI003F4968DE
MDDVLEYATATCDVCLHPMQARGLGDHAWWACETCGIVSVAVGQPSSAAAGSSSRPSAEVASFSIPKSASVLWGVAGAASQARIVQAHHAAVAEAVAFLEREVAATRTGATAGDGAVAQVGVAGVIATAFDHFDSRAGDPHLHTHVVISNKVQTVLDGRWRSLDGRPVHAAVVALSELHEALFADALTRALGLGWEERARGAATAIRRGRSRRYPRSWLPSSRRGRGTSMPRPIG